VSLSQKLCELLATPRHRHAPHLRRQHDLHLYLQVLSEANELAEFTTHRVGRGPLSQSPIAVFGERLRGEFDVAESMEVVESDPNDTTCARTVSTRGMESA